ncbi:hypothetical protein TPHA_0B02760 [Tetrapisispora phaffii CBS 4417]|uniref:Uncharacterized protein n=1 Tax=Tetrapisispora phaffii (strain ATCC 24235 / CBS 4417 / NBRC 1672 / NRRL Y-8282 / UCD 70-5) TaxID=1071381 RepID=G8BPL7_TETPH|nr:hypothetical protein TPHA_0B02760 [Tetrapisispora phaffii CBS 4417]CCE61948.1 hypothetical protein TPHA_0B02760 [Tetrapisispora phaffii CBS 4417]
MANDLEIQIQTLITAFVSYLINVIQISIPFITQFSNAHPTLFLGIISVIIMYVAIRIILSIWSILKRLFYVSLFIFAFLIYLRGIDQFFNNDVPFLYNLVLQDKDLETIIIQSCAYLSSTSVTSSTLLYKFLKSKVVEYISQL